MCFYCFVLLQLIPAIQALITCSPLLFLLIEVHALLISLHVSQYSYVRTIHVAIVRRLSTRMLILSVFLQFYPVKNQAHVAIFSWQWYSYTLQYHVRTISYTVVSQVLIYTIVSCTCTYHILIIVYVYCSVPGKRLQALNHKPPISATLGAYPVYCMAACNVPNLLQCSAFFVGVALTEHSICKPH